MKHKDDHLISILQLTAENPVASICPALNMISPTAFTLEAHDLRILP